MSQLPNVVFVLADQLRAASLPIYGEAQISTPHIDRLAADGVVLDHCISTSPVCTPYRSMLLTGRHPQTTGHIHNSIRTRHTEISIADAFANAGYRTGWVGKWHLHTGNWPSNWAPDWVPEGRDRLGFEFWRAYNMHMIYFGGFVQTNGDWEVENWEGYETDALNRYGIEYMDAAGDEPFCLFLSPHQPHFTPHQFAPDAYYERLPEQPELPGNVPESLRAESLAMYRHYLAMTLALDDMVGQLLDYLDRTGRAENTLVVFTSDHGSQVGAQGIRPWSKKHPYQASLHVPCVLRLPGVLEGGQRRETLTAPVDLMPSLCTLCGVPIPRTVEGHDLSTAWRGDAGAFEQQAVLTMNFSSRYDWIGNGQEWRGVRTQGYNYAAWLDGRRELFDLRQDPLEMCNVADAPEYSAVRRQLEETMRQLQAQRGDVLGPCEMYRDWFDTQRRVVRNAYGPLGHPEGEPDWSLLV